ncbi:MAG: adenylate/guanylate cyclase domain-containing protein [bacterium]
MKLGIENKEKITQLISTLQLAKSTNCLIIAKCNELELRELIYEKVSTAFQNKISIYKLKIDASNKDLPGILSKTEVAPDVVFFVYGIEEAMPDVIKYLNFKREVFYEIKRPVVIWVNDFVLREIGTKALDFWAFRSRVFEFRMPKMEKVIPESIKELLNKRREIDKAIRRDYKQKVTLMLTDIVGSTQYRDIAWRAILQRHNDMLFPIIEKHNGKIIKTTGDAIMAGFEKAEDGVFSAIKMQKALAEYNKGVEDKIHIRIGLHTGMVITKPDDIYGYVANIGARIEALAEEDQILISGAVKDGFTEKGFNLYFCGNYSLKGIAERIPIYEVLWFEGQKPKKSKKPEEPVVFSLHNQTPPEPNFVGRIEELKAITNWYKSPEVKIGALVGWGGVGKSALVRKWFDCLKESNIHPDGIFWWGFYRNPYLDRFLIALFVYLSQDRFKLDDYKTSWQKIDKIKELLLEREYLIILDGLEEMQKSQSDNEFGKMQHPEFTDLLKYIADADFRGLFIVTTRFSLTDIEKYLSYQRLEIEELSREDTRLLFQRIGVRGGEDEIDAIWKEFKGHTLSLVLLANYLGPGGDIKRAKEIPSFYSDKEAGGKAYRILLWYDKQLNEEQRRFMKIFSLFRGAVSEREFEGVFQTKMDFHFQRMVENLCQRRLITKGDHTYTTHPLIKGYFESIFDKEEKKLTHKAIYEYFGKRTKDMPQTLEEMQPLFEQVYHGCSAGLYDEVYNDVYQDKIHRGNEFYITHKLGAYAADLSLSLNFFPNKDLSQMPGVSKKQDRAWLLNETGVSLLFIGRPSEARDLMIRAIKMDIENEDWKNASLGYQNLADLQISIGEVISTKEASKKALEMAEKANDKQYIVISKVRLGYSLFLLGETESAERYFKEADRLQKEIDPEAGGLYAFSGDLYADLLMELERIADAFRISKRNLEICMKYKWPNNISKCHRSLGKIERIRKDYHKSKKHLDKALQIGKAIGVPYLEIEALIEFGRLKLEINDYKGCEKDLQNALKLCAHTGFKLYEPEAELILAKLYSAQGNSEQAKPLAQSAYQKASQMHYHWPKLEALAFIRRDR